MAKIIDFRSGKSRDADDHLTDSGVSPALSGTKRVSSPKVDKETYLLWLFSKDIDQLITRYIVEHNLRPEEVAAILSHRLGQLVSSTAHPEKLEEFCESVMRRMAQVSDEDPNQKGKSGREDEGAS